MTIVSTDVPTTGMARGCSSWTCSFLRKALICLRTLWLHHCLKSAAFCKACESLVVSGGVRGSKNTRARTNMEANTTEKHMPHPHLPPDTLDRRLDRRLRGALLRCTILRTALAAMLSSSSVNARWSPLNSCSRFAHCSSIPDPDE